MVEGWALEGRTPAQIEGELGKAGIRHAEWPSRRTIQRTVQAVRVEDRSGPWSLADATDDEAQLILPILRAYLNLTSLRPVRSSRDLFITKAEARWIVKVQRAAPGLHVVNVYRLVRAYLAREVRRLPTYDLDALLAFEPWDDEPRTRSDGVPYLTRETYEKGVREGWIPAAPRFLMQELAGIEWRPTTEESDLHHRAVYWHEPDAYEAAGVPPTGDEDSEGGPDGETRKR